MGKRLDNAWNDVLPLPDERFARCWFWTKFCTELFPDMYSVLEIFRIRKASPFHLTKITRVILTETRITCQAIRALCFC